MIRGIPQLRDGSRLRAWLFGIARRTLMDRLRQRSARSPTVDVDVDEIAADTSAAEEAEDLQELERALAEVPVVEREVLTLFYLHELSLNEVAEALNVPVGTIKSRLFRAKRLLRQTMTARGLRRSIMTHHRFHWPTTFAGSRQRSCPGRRGLGTSGCCSRRRR